MKQILNIKIDKIRINGTGFFLCAIAYIYISIFVFLIGWMKYIISIPTSIILLIAIYQYYKKSKKNLENVQPIYISMKVFLPLCFMIILLGWILGWTGFANQTLDYPKHNAILSDLTNKAWPVYYENNGETSMLTYYLGQYIVPSLIGKLFSSVNVAMLANGIWAMLGLLLAVLGIFKVTKADNSKKQIVALGITLFFSTCLILSRVLGELVITNQPIGTGHWFMMNDTYKLQYSSNLVLLRWVFPQCIVPWIIFTIFYDNRFDIEHYVILCLPILFYASFSFIGMLCFLFTMVIIYGVKTKNIKLLLKKIFSPSNIIVGVTLGSILLLYFLGNVLTEKPEDISLQMAGYSGSNIWVYICFILSVLPYTFLLFKRNKKNPFYWIATVILLILPFFRMGLYNDFCMRVSIIPLLVYTILTIDSILYEKSKICKGIIIGIFLIGAITPIEELYTSVTNMSVEFLAGNYRYSLESTANRKMDVGNDAKYNYYTYDLEDCIFYQYLAKKKMNE